MSRSIAFVCGLLAASAVSATAWAATPTSLYNDNCSACHQTTGKGVKGAFPALAGDPVVQGDAAPLTATWSWPARTRCRRSATCPTGPGLGADLCPLRVGQQGDARDPG